MTMSGSLLLSHSFSSILSCCGGSVANCAVTHPVSLTLPPLWSYLRRISQGNCLARDCFHSVASFQILFNTMLRVTDPCFIIANLMGLLLITSHHVTMGFVPIKKDHSMLTAAVDDASQFIYVAQIGKGVVTTTSHPLFSTSKANVEDAAIGGAATAAAAAESDNNQSSAISLLNDAIGYNPSAAVALLDQVEKMRQNGVPREEMEEFWNNMLSNGPDSPLPLWAKFRPLARFSSRARLATLRRTLDLTTPPASESEDDNNEMSMLQRRRRALVSLLRDIGKTSNDSNEVSDKVTIVSVFRKARQMTKTSSATDLKSRMPEGLESPNYEVLDQRGALEIRRYAPYSLCSVSMNKPRPKDSSTTDANLQMPQMSGASSFGALAGYLFGKNDQSTAMKMTTPVFTAPTTGEEQMEEKQMSFVLPSQYWRDGSLEEAPKPLSGSGVTLEQIKSEDRAVIMFGGYASKKEVDIRKKSLLAAITKDDEWRVLSEDITVAQYNDPFTAPWRRLNEVSVPIIKK